MRGTVPLACNYEWVQLIKDGIIFTAKISNENNIEFENLQEIRRNGNRPFADKLMLGLKNKYTTDTKEFLKKLEEIDERIQQNISIK